MSKCVHDSLCPPLFAEDPEGDLQALEQWRDSDVDERAEHDDLQLLAQLRAGEIAASDLSPGPPPVASAAASTPCARPWTSEAPRPERKRQTARPNKHERPAVTGRSRGISSAAI